MILLICPIYLSILLIYSIFVVILKYDTEADPKNYKITGEVTQNCVAQLLWNILYDVLLAQLSIISECEACCISG